MMGEREENQDLGTMTAEAHHCSLEVSAYFFRLATECLRLHSNETFRFQTLHHLVDDYAQLDWRVEGHDIAVLKEHLDIVPTGGEIRIDFDISPRGMDCLNEILLFIQDNLAINLSIGDALSVLMFDFVVEHHSGRIMNAVKMD